jgi:SEC-C motif-containing protein
MRSRYSAYALGRVGYLMRTTDPQGPQHQADARAWQADLEGWCARTELLGLEILSASEEGDTGRVWFRATIQQGDRTGVLEERSLFYRRGGRWLYFAAEPA